MNRGSRSDSVASSICVNSEITGISLEEGLGRLPALRPFLAETISGNLGSDFVEIDAREGTRALSVGEMWRRAQSVSSDLEAADVGEGAALVLCFESCLDLVAATWAAIASGRSFYPWQVLTSNPRTQDFGSRSTFLRRCFGECVFVTSADLAERFRCESGDGFSPVVVPSFDSEGFSDTGMVKDGGAGESARIYLQTSGTTGRPKLAVLPFRAFAERQAVRRTLVQTNPVKALSLLPFDNVTALGDLLPKAVDSVFLHPECFAADPASLFRAVSDHGVKSIGLASSEAVRLVSVLESEEELPDCSSLSVVRFGREPIVPEVLRRLFRGLEKRVGATPSVNFGYGLTETSILTFTEGGSLEKLLRVNRDSPHVSLGGAARGKSVRIVDGEGSLLPEGRVGHIEARLEFGLIEGYLDESGKIELLETRGGWFATGDMGFIRDGALTVTGREKEILIVGGRNVSLVGVDDAMRKVEGVRPECVAAVAVEGDGMVLFFSATESAREEIERIAGNIRVAVAASVGVQADAIVSMEPGSFPVTNTGKIIRGELADRFSRGEFEAVEEVAPDSAEVVSMNDVERRMAELWQSVLGLERVPGRDENFYVLGGDSLQGASLIRAVESAFGRRVDIAWFFANPTIRTLCESWYECEGEGGPILVRLTDHAEGVPLFLVPGGMGTENELMVFAGLVGHFETERTVFGFRAPLERFAREGAALSVEELARLYLTELKKVQPCGPYVICGECVAGAIAFEMTRQLLDSGNREVHLILLDSLCPNKDRYRRFEESGYPSLEEGHGEELAQRVFGYYLALADYSPVPITADASLIVAEDSRNIAGKTEGWKDYVSGSLRIERVPGDHDSYIRAGAEVTGAVLGKIVEEVLHQVRG